MKKVSQFKSVLRSVVSEPLYSLSDRGAFQRIVLSGLENSRTEGLSFLEISKGFLRFTAPEFLAEQLLSKTGKISNEIIIRDAISNLFSDQNKLDEAIISCLSSGKFPVSIKTEEVSIGIDLGGLLRFAFGETIHKELKAVFSCLRHSEKSEILKQIQIDDFQSGKSLRRLFQKDSEALKNGDRDNEKLQKFLERMEGMGAFVYEKYKHS